MLKIELTNTSAGLTAIQRAIAGDDITFTKLVIGDGTITNPDISNLTNVVNEIKYFPLGVVKPEDEEMLRVRSNINNVGLTEDKVIREYGLFAKFGSEQEFLFAYLNSGESTTPLPKASGGRYDLNRDFVLYAGNSNNIVFDTNGDLVYATLNDIKAMDAKKENAFGKNSGFNLEKTNLTENDSNKLFTAKGALDLLNDITGRISTAISDCKTVLRKEMLNIKTELLSLISGNTSKLENLERKCHYRIGDLLITLDNQNPALTWVGTTWIKIEDKFLLGASGSLSLGSTGGSKKIIVSNLPSHNHSASSKSTGGHTHTSGNHRHKVDNHIHTNVQHKHSLGANVVTETGSGAIGGVGSYGNIFITETRLGGGENTGGAAPYTDNQNPTTSNSGNHSHTITVNNTGSGTDYLPPYQAVNIWKRLS